jgi:hypothetical protein
MITTEVTIKRSSSMWGDSFPDKVYKYLTELMQTKAELEKRYMLGIYGDIMDTIRNDALSKAVINAIDGEINLCKFYIEHLDRQKKDKSLNKWVLIKQEDVKPLHDWIPVAGEQWIKTNGRIKACIQFDRTGKMLKLSLSYQNDSKFLTFLPSRQEKDNPIAHVKSETSIETKINEFKRQADTFLNNHQFPPYSNNEYETFRQLLHLE